MLRGVPMTEKGFNVKKKTTLKNLDITESPYKSTFHNFKQHINKCSVSLCEKDVTILGYNNREDHLFTLEATLQFEIIPKINEKEKFKTKTLSISF